MNVVILTEGGKQIGFGHLARCSALYAAFLEKGVKPLMVVNGDTKTSTFLKGVHYKFLDWINEKEKLLGIIDDVDIVAMDSYLAKRSLYKLVSSRVKKNLFFDDTLRLLYPQGFVINGTANAKKLPYLKRKGISYLLGTKYALVRKEFWNTAPKKISNELKRILVIFGGANIGGMMPRVIGVLCRVYPGLHKRVMLGHLFGTKACFERTGDERTAFIASATAAILKKEMLACDVAISAGGQTLFELARLGVPTIAISVADNQRNNIEGFDDAGFVSMPALKKTPIS